MERLASLFEQRLRESKLCKSEVRLFGRPEAIRWLPDKSSFYLHNLLSLNLCA